MSTIQPGDIAKQAGSGKTVRVVNIGERYALVEDYPRRPGNCFRWDVEISRLVKV